MCSLKSYWGTSFSIAIVTSMGLSMHDVCIIQHGSSMMHRILAMILTLYDTGIQHYSIYMNVMSRINWHHVLELLRQMSLPSRQCSAWHPVLPKANGWVWLPSIAHQAMQCLASWAILVKWASSIAPHAMQSLASCATRVKRVSLIAFDCTPGHAVLGILCNLKDEFDCLDCTPGHAVLGILCNLKGEFDCLDCTPGHAVLGILRYTTWRVSSIAFDCTPGHAVLGILRCRSQLGEFNCLRLHPRPVAYPGINIGRVLDNVCVKCVRKFSRHAHFCRPHPPI